MEIKMGIRMKGWGIDREGMGRMDGWKRSKISQVGGPRKVVRQSSCLGTGGTMGSEGVPASRITVALAMAAVTRAELER